MTSVWSGARDILLSDALLLLQGLLDSDPTRGFLTLLNIVSRDASVLLDFLVSNETCFLLYLLRYLKFVVKVGRSACCCLLSCALLTVCRTGAGL